MIRALLRSGPKYLISTVVVIASVTGFCLWLLLRHPKQKAGIPTPIVAEDLSAKLAKIESRIDSLVLVDNVLYDLNTGELIFGKWLKEGMPVKFFWEADTKTVLAQYEHGFVRYRLDGTEQASLVQKFQFGIADDYKWIVFAKDKDIWRADVDWKELKLVNERKLTSIGQFNDANFAANIMLFTDKTVVVRNLNQVLRVSLENGDVHPTKLPLLEIGKRRSPDSKSVVGLQNGQFYCYDVDTDEAKTTQVGRGAITDCQWIGNDRCVWFASGKQVILYDRPKNILAELAALPTVCNRIGEPSPDGRFIFCTGRGGGALVDVERKTAVSIIGGAGVSWVSKETFAYSREVPDSDLRGTWLQTIGQGEKRISPEPYLVGNRGGFIMPVPKAGVVVFATKQGLSKMKADGSELAEVVKLAHPPERVLGIEDWKQ